MTDQTTFLVAHNQAGEDLELNIHIYTVDGRLVKQLNSEFTASGNVSRELTWDGTTDGGRPLTDGFYVYHVLLKNTATGEEIKAAKRLVLLRP